MDLRTCVAPNGEFVYGIHKPRFRAVNLRESDRIETLGSLGSEGRFDNRANFPPDDVDEQGSDWIYEIPNAFPFRGATYILKSWADERARHNSHFRLPQPPQLSFSALLKEWFTKDAPDETKIDRLFQTLPQPLKLALAANSTDPEDLTRLAQLSCEFVFDSDADPPAGLTFEPNGRQAAKPSIADHTLFEVLANNIHLPNKFKQVMVLRPGAQGRSEITGEWPGAGGRSHVWEYLRRNSYIPWGHYAANMAEDAVRYRIDDLTHEDMSALRHLYYQRTFVRLAQEMGLKAARPRKSVSPEELEALRARINKALSGEVKRSSLKFDSTLWGWNFGSDFSPSGYRLHASHQQIHQQYAMIPGSVDTPADDRIPAYGYGDLIAGFIGRYREMTGENFFNAYIRAIRSNRRVDGSETGKQSLIVHEDRQMMIFVPKAQTSQWELQLMTLKPVGNILEADADTRRSLDSAILVAMKILNAMGARMVTVVESSKRFDNDDTDQRLLYGFYPRLPQSPGAFSEQQLRWISGHYPEDFAAACRSHLPEALKSVTM